MIRIVHMNGHVEELSGPIPAGEVLKANPNHVLSKPSSQGVVRRILILSPDSDLKRGQIYFLIPASSVPEKKNKKIQRKKDPSKKKNKPEQALHRDHYLSETLSEKKSSRRDRRAGRVGVWRPHLESISEDS